MITNPYVEKPHLLEKDMFFYRKKAELISLS